jgi:hypothetical protein
MMRSASLLGGMLVLTIVFAPAAPAQESHTLEGHWIWDALGDTGSVEAVFTPTGEGTWEVAFHFNYRGAHVYKGTAEGSLSDGELNGEVAADDQDRTFSFRGRVRKGKFRGTHFETTGGSRRKTGSLSMKG